MEEGKTVCDRELFENPTHHMVPPLVNDNCRMFYLQVSGEIL